MSLGSRCRAGVTLAALAAVTLPEPPRFSCPNPSQPKRHWGLQPVPARDSARPHAPRQSRIVTGRCLIAPTLTWWHLLLLAGLVHLVQWGPPSALTWLFWQPRAFSALLWDVPSLSPSPAPPAVGVMVTLTPQHQHCRGLFSCRNTNLGLF